MRRFVVEVVVSTIATLVATLLFATLPSPHGPTPSSGEAKPSVQAWMPSVAPASGMPFAIDTELLWPSAAAKPTAGNAVALTEQRSGRAARHAEHQPQPRTAQRAKPACDAAAGACREIAQASETPAVVQPVVLLAMRDESEPLLQRPKRLLLSAASDALDFGQDLIRTVHSAADKILPN